MGEVKLDLSNIAFFCPHLLTQTVSEQRLDGILVGLVEFPIRAFCRCAKRDKALIQLAFQSWHTFNLVLEQSTLQQITADLNNVARPTLAIAATCPPKGLQQILESNRIQICSARWNRLQLLLIIRVKRCPLPEMTYDLRKM